MSELYSPVVSICLSKRKRFAWAAWWTGAPCTQPFRKPDAHGGGARSPEEAQRAAEVVAGVSLRVVESSWSRAWSRILVGQVPFPDRPLRAAVPEPANATSIWSTLGVDARVDAEELKRAFRQRAMETHPDRGGSDEAFRAVMQAYADAQKRVARPRRRSS